MASSPIAPPRFERSCKACRNKILAENASLLGAGPRASSPADERETNTPLLFVFMLKVCLSLCLSVTQPVSAMYASRRPADRRAWLLKIERRFDIVLFGDLALLDDWSGTRHTATEVHPNDPEDIYVAHFHGRWS